MSTKNPQPFVVAAQPKGSTHAPRGGSPNPPVGAAPASAPKGVALDSFRVWAGHGPLVLAGVAVGVVGSVPLAVAWFVASRLAYVGFVGFALRAQSRHGALTRHEGPEAAWRKFRGRASRLMFGDVIAFMALCVVTRGTLALPGPVWLALTAGLVLVVIGIGIKFWATASLDAGTFYWRDFFVPHEHTNRSASGPYRWLANPMYTVGYAHAYGFGLLLSSWPGLAGAAFAQLGITLVAVLVERPHGRRFARG
ncbi:MAG: hypothetical protein EXS08_08870 [Planctomycetes bacterium]|nr:hypothetical protein [Planctomycetota bacterium]